MSRDETARRDTLQDTSDPTREPLDVNWDESLEKAWAAITARLVEWGVELKPWRRETTDEALVDAVGLGPNEPNTELRFYRTQCHDGSYSQGMDTSFNVFKWLKERAEFSPFWDKYFGMWTAKTYNGEDPDSWVEALEKFVEHLSDEGYDLRAYGDSAGVPIVDCSYNSENMLSNDLLQGYFEFHDRGECVAFLATGTGWYSRPRAFLIDDNAGGDSFDYAKGTVSCDGKHEGVPHQTPPPPKHPPEQLPLLPDELDEAVIPTPPEVCTITENEHIWFTDNACDFRRDQPEHEEKNLEDLPVRVHGQVDPLDANRVVDGWIFGAVYVDSADVPHCPRCGGQLSLYWQ